MGTRQSWNERIRFECQGSGQCCVTHGESGYVYLTREDARRLAGHLKVAVGSLRPQFARRVDGRLALRDAPGSADCIFLEQRRCAVYLARPTQCRTWPFWPELLNARAWSKQVASLCPGVGKGRLWSREEIRAAAQVQARADEEG